MDFNEIIKSIGVEPYFRDTTADIVIYCADCRDVLPKIPDKSIDLLLTDPPYGISFMGKDWDKALSDRMIWLECLRVLKDGAFAFVMCTPRADCLSRMIISLEDAGFRVNFSPIYWCYSSGFPKAENIGKMVDKRLGVERKKGGIRTDGRGKWDLKMNREKGDTGIGHADGSKRIYQEEFATSQQAKSLNGSYGGFQPKPAVEVIIVAMKPLSEKTYVEQALENGKGITWLDDGRIPYESPKDIDITAKKNAGNALLDRGDLYGGYGDLDPSWQNPSGRFPANLLVSDDVLNGGKITKSTGGKSGHTGAYSGGYKEEYYGDNKPGLGDSGSLSRYFDLDKWWEERIKELPESVQKTFPFLIVPKASKSEKNKGCEDLPEVTKVWNGQSDKSSTNIKDVEQRWTTKVKNNHPTVKPLKLMSYLVTLGSRNGDTVLDPFLGSGTASLACQMLNRKSIGIEINKDYCEIAKKRLSQSVMRL